MVAEAFFDFAPVLEGQVVAQRKNPGYGMPDSFTTGPGLLRETSHMHGPPDTHHGQWTQRDLRRESWKG